MIKIKHYGDITKLKGSELPIVDIITGGSPCQDLSVAGKRAGLQGERSGLFMEQIRIVKEMREHDRTISGADVDIRCIRPRYMVWENVPGAFSSNKGEDFRCVLEETARVADKAAVIPRPTENKGKWTPSGCIMGDGWSIAWRVHDAQFWGVPQRRKRVCLVADFGGQSAPEILFESKSLSGHFEQGEEKRESATADVGAGVNSANKPLAQTWGGEIAGTLDASYYKGCGERAGVEREVVCIGNGQLCNMSMQPIANTLDTMHDQQAVLCSVAYGVDCYNQSMSKEVAKSLTIIATDSDHIPGVCYGLDRASFNQGQNAQFDFSIEDDLSPTLTSRGAGG